MQAEDFDCRACGACCFSRLETYVRVWGADYARLAEHPVHGARIDELVRFVGNRAYLALVDADDERGRCAALAVEGGRFGCTIYEGRPETCRALGSGSPSCLAERDAKLARARRLAGLHGE
jgi:Fe-S-cluster containining protein